MILSSREFRTLLKNSFRLVSRVFSREESIGTGLKRRFSARKSGGDDGGEGSILGLKQTLGKPRGRGDNGEEREGL